ncbi:MAG: LuxR C-terminal-related transcriptional regulator, partial [Anaerolineae bacterium]|nr:LuxR C-terminal-related transcriptional regulator [Anaerolineae bacterium]
MTGTALFEALTQREHEILILVAEGLSNQEIADRLFVALSTIKWYIRQIYNKMGVDNRRQAIARAQEAGLLGAPPLPASMPLHNLPAQTTPFVGREAELDHLAALLANPEVRLMTILAPGGMGKTRLALEAAEQQIGRFPDGVYFVPLTALSSPDPLMHTIAEHTAYDFQSDGRPPLQQILDFLRPKRLLLVLDNFEHLLEGAPLVTEILQAAPGVTALVTSRERLNLHSETVFTVGSMPFPLGETAPSPLDYEAGQLFQRSVSRARADIQIPAADWPHVARICRLVEGMPLAIVLAAAWVEVLSIAEIADEISQSIDFLAAEMRDSPRRQWSIQAVFEPTWQRLTEAQRAVLMKLAVFRGGFSRRAAQLIAGASLLDLHALVNKALLTRNDEGRYSLHGLLRQFAEQRLRASGQMDAVRDAHAAYYAQAMQARLGDLKGPNQLETLGDIEIDLENLRTGWTWALEHSMHGAADQYLESLGIFFFMRSRLQEGIEWFSAAAAKTANLPGDSARSTHNLIQIWQAQFLQHIWNLDQAVQLAEQGLAVARAQHDEPQIALALYTLGMAFATIGGTALEQARPLALESLDCYQRLGEPFWMARVYQLLGYIVIMQNHFDQNLEYTRQALDLRRAIGDQLGIANSLLNLGAALQEIGQWELSEQYTQEGMPVFREYGHSATLGIALRNRVAQSFFRGDFEQAEASIAEGLSFSLRQNLRNHIVALTFQRSLGSLLRGDYAEALRLAEEAHQAGLDLANGDASRFEAEYPLVAVGCARCGLGDFAGVRPLLETPLARIEVAPAANLALRYNLTGLAA